MHELPGRVPIDILLMSSAEDISFELLDLLRLRGHPSVKPGNEINILWEPSYYQNRPSYDVKHKDAATLVVAEAWAWLEHNGFIADLPGYTENGTKLLTRKAKTVETKSSFRDDCRASLLRQEMLHASLKTKVYLAYVRGEYASAVFQAMHSVEVLVREVAGFGNDLFGITLMRKAFDPETGPLRDPLAEGEERKGRADLFAGAIASYKNPHSHRDVNIVDPMEALETILLANHLLKIVDARRNG